MKNQLLLLEDVEGIGRSGDIVTVKPGFARNFLFPKKKAVIAEKHTIRLQEKLKEERAAQAIIDKKSAEALAKKLEDMSIKTETKIDVEGHMYGSVSAQDIVVMMKEQHAIAFEKRNVILPKPIRKLGGHEIALKLKEGVDAMIHLEIIPETKAAE